MVSHLEDSVNMSLALLVKTSLGHLRQKMYYIDYISCNQV